MDEIQLSTYGRASSTPSPVNRMMAAFSSGFRPKIDINLGVGYVSSEAIPRAAIRAAYQRVLSSNTKPYDHALNYGPPTGVDELIGAIRRWHKRRYGQAIADSHRVIIGPSGATSLLESAAHTLKEGIVVTSDPVYYIYTDLLERLGFELLAVPEDGQGISAEALAQKVDQLGAGAQAISFFYLVTVANPTCTVLSNARRRQITDFVTGLSKRLGRTVPLLLDTAYEPLVHDPSIEPVESSLGHDPLGVAHEIGSMSKIFAPALRVGYLMGKDSPFMAAMVQKASDAALGAPPLSQHVAAQLIDHHMTDQCVAANTAYGRKAKQVRQWIDQYLGEHLADCRGGQAGFYFYLTLNDTPTHEQSAFYQYLTRTTGDGRVDQPDGDFAPRVIYVPGTFCVHPGGDLVETAQRQLRISYGYEDLQQIEKAMAAMAKAATYAQQAS